MSGLNDINKQEPENGSNHSQLVAPPQCMQASHPGEGDSVLRRQF